MFLVHFRKNKLMFESVEEVQKLINELQHIYNNWHKEYYRGLGDTWPYGRRRDYY